MKEFNERVEEFIACINDYEIYFILFYFVYKMFLQIFICILDTLVRSSMIFFSFLSVSFWIAWPNLTYPNLT